MPSNFLEKPVVRLFLVSAAAVGALADQNIALATAVATAMGASISGTNILSNLRWTNASNNTAAGTVTLTPATATTLKSIQLNIAGLQTASASGCTLETLSDDVATLACNTLLKAGESLFVNVASNEPFSAARGVTVNGDPVTDHCYLETNPLSPELGAMLNNTQLENQGLNCDGLSTVNTLGFPVSFDATTGIINFNKLAYWNAMTVNKNLMPFFQGDFETLLSNPDALAAFGTSLDQLVFVPRVTDIILDLTSLNNTQAAINFLRARSSVLTVLASFVNSFTLQRALGQKVKFLAPGWGGNVVGQSYVGDTPASVFQDALTVFKYKPPLAYQATAACAMTSADDVNCTSNVTSLAVPIEIACVTNNQDCPPNVVMTPLANRDSQSIATNKKGLCCSVPNTDFFKQLSPSVSGFVSLGPVNASLVLQTCLALGEACRPNVALVSPSNRGVSDKVFVGVLLGLAAVLIIFSIVILRLFKKVCIITHERMRTYLRYEERLGHLTAPNAGCLKFIFSHRNGCLLTFFLSDRNRAHQQPPLVTTPLITHETDEPETLHSTTTQPPAEPATYNPDELIEGAITCIISHSIMETAFIAHDGYSYEKQYAEMAMDEQRGRMRSLTTAKPMSSRNIIPNEALQKAINAYNSGDLSNLDQAFKCSETGVEMSMPYVASNGLSYQHSVITAILQDPAAKERLGITSNFLIENINLKQLIYAWHDTQILAALAPPDDKEQPSSRPFSPRP